MLGLFPALEAGWGSLMGEPFAEVAPGEGRVLLPVFFMTLFVVVGVVGVGTSFVARDAA